MKKIILILLGLFAIIPTTVLAETQVRDLRETVQSIGLTFKATNYQETKDQVVVYLFRMNTCEHCHDAISWFNDIASEHGQKFKLRSFEITNNTDNSSLYKKTVAYLNLKEGVPLIIVGDQYFRGFSDSTKDKVLNAIDEVYESKDTYDIFEEMEKNPKEEENNNNVETESKPNTTTMIIFCSLGAIILIIIILFIIKK